MFLKHITKIEMNTLTDVFWVKKLPKIMKFFDKKYFKKERWYFPFSSQNERNHFIYIVIF